MTYRFSYQNQVSYKKIFGALLDENLSWKEHLKHIENKIAKSIG